MRTELSLRSGAFALLASLALASPAIGQACDIPLLVQEGNVAPNVLIILDSSGSMNHHIYHAAYDQQQSYSGPFESDDVYYYSGDTELRGPNSFDSGLGSAPKFMASRGPNGQSGRYYGNYLNWIFFHASDAQRAEISTLTRMDAAHAAVNALLSNSPGLRYGLMTFDGSNGGKLRAAVGTPIATLQSTVSSTAGSGWTPSAETMVDAIEYFQEDGASAPIQADCQGNFIVFLTDGHPTQDRDVPTWIGDQDGDGREPGDCASIGLPDQDSDCSDYLDDVAYYLANNDMRDDLDGDQFVYTYMIGFGVDAPLMADTAENGQGSYHLAWDLGSLTQALGAVVDDIVHRISAGAAVAVVSTETGDDDRLYRGKFMPGLWRGYLESFALPHEPGDAPVWEAGALLQDRSASSRDIFTAINGARVEFVDGSAAALAPYLGAADVDEAADVIRYTRGEDVAGARDRDGWKLGDLVYSTPVVVGPPSQFILSSDYQSFLRAHASRERVVYVGSNDGLLHAFRASSGEELWAFAPLGVMHKLSLHMDPKYCHATTVDLTPTVYDVKIGGSWRTVLFGGERTGGDSYFAIDITNPANPDVLWETSIPLLGSSFSEPAVVRTPNYTALWTGSAPDVGGQGSVSILDAATGNLHVPAAVISNHFDTNMVTRALAVDIDFDGFDDLVYQADLAGYVYRWTRQPNGYDWQADVVFSTGGQPIQTQPTAAYLDDGDLMILFGTGQYVDSSDVATSAQQSFYAFRDDPDQAVMLTPADLPNVTSAMIDPSEEDGWRLDLGEALGERVIEPAVVIEGVAYFTSFAPSAEQCSAGGDSWLYAVDFQSGAAIDRDTGEAIDDPDARATALGSGIGSRPVVALGDGTIIVQTSDARLNVEDLAVMPRIMRVWSWQEDRAGNGAQIEDPENTTAGY